MNHDKNSVKRSHFRAPVSARTTAVLVDDYHRGSIRRTGDIAGLQELAAASGDKTMTTFFSALVGILRDIDEKLERIILKLDNQEARIQELDVVDTVDISGSGVSLLLKQPLENGQVLRIAIQLPDYPFGRFEALGRVVRTVQKTHLNDSLYLTGIEFTGLTEEEKECLVKFTFSQQRKHIRSSVKGEL